MMLMTPDTLLAAMTFAAVCSVTPGPGNMMMLAAGMGLGALMLQSPQLHLALKVLGISDTIWLAWKLLRVGVPTASAAPNASVGAPMGLWVSWALRRFNGSTQGLDDGDRHEAGLRGDRERAVCDAAAGDALLGGQPAPHLLVGFRR